MKMKKGFTLVELAIVLVIIGLLIGMAVKGKSLIDSANMKAEVGKISKIKSAVDTYFIKHDRLPGIGSDGAAITSQKVYEQLVYSSELLSDADFAAFDGEFSWVFVGCSSFNDANGKRWALETIKASSGLCAYLSTSKPIDMNNPATNSLVNPTMSGTFICQVEMNVDDKNVRSGLGRYVRGTDVTEGVGAANYKCSDKTVVNQADLNYVFKIH